MAGVSIISCYNTVVIDQGSRGPRGLPGADGANLTVQAGTGSISSGILSFGDSNGVSFGLNNGTLTASIDVPSNTHSHSKLTFVNSNNLTLVEQNGIVTGAASFPPQSVQPVAFSVPNGSAEFQTIKFANSNGVSFGSGPQGITASVNGITTAAQSNHSHGPISLSLSNVSGNTASASNGLTISLSGPGSSSFANANGITFGSNGNTVTASHNGLTTAAQSNHSHGNPLLAVTGINATTASNSGGFTLSLSNALSFANSNGVSFGSNGNTVTASHNGITTGMQSQMTSAFMSTGERDNYFYTSNKTFVESSQFSVTAHTHGSVLLALTNLSGTATSLSDGLTLSLSAVTYPEKTFVNGNNFTFGTSNNEVTASFDAGSHVHAFSAGTASSTFNTLKFLNTNNVSFINKSGLIAVSADFLTTAARSQHSHTISAPNGSSVFMAAMFANSNYVSFSLSAGSIVGHIDAARNTHSHGNPTLNLTNISGTTASASDGLTLSLSAGGGGAASASNSSITFNTLSFGNSNGMSFYMTNGSIVGSFTGADAGAMAISVSNTSTTASLLHFGNLNGLSFYLTNGSICGSYTDAGAGEGISIVRISAGTTHRDVSDFSFADSNGLSFGISSKTITASHNGLTTAAQSNHSHGNPTLNLTNISGTTASASNGLTLSLSAGNILSFDNSNGITFGLNANTVTASHNGLTTAAQSNHSHGNPTLNLTNISGTTASASNGFTLSLSAGGGGAASGSNGSFTFNTLSFGNSNDASFYTTNSSIVLSYNKGGAASCTNGSFTFNTLKFADLNGASFYTTNGSIALSYIDEGAGEGMSALGISAGGTNSLATGYSFVGAGDADVTMNGRTIEISASGSPKIDIESYNFYGTGTDYSASTQVSKLSFDGPLSNHFTDDYFNSISNYVIFNSDNYKIEFVEKSTYLTNFVVASAGSTASQTINGFNASSGRALFFPFRVDQNIKANAIRLIESISHVTGTYNPAYHTQVIGFGLYFRDTGTNKDRFLTYTQEQSSVFRIGDSITTAQVYRGGEYILTRRVTANAASVTLECQNIPHWYIAGAFEKSDSVGIDSSSVTASGSAQIQSLWGTNAWRELVLPINSCIFDPKSEYCLALHISGSSENQNIGLSNAIIGNVIVENRAFGIGQASSAVVTQTKFKGPITPPFVFSKTFADWNNETGKETINLSQCSFTNSIFPLMTLFFTTGTRS